ncbi:MAG TPA: capsular polysaccharide biosynthesis protein [Caulobacteraceae bacterium]|nr:capsular polysaccharide biosynthesis protein [Caulobacteraceae bacterium]
MTDTLESPPQVDGAQELTRGDRRLSRLDSSGGDQPSYRSTLVPAWGVAATPHLEAFLPECGRLERRLYSGRETDSIAGWGFKRTAWYARALARRLGVPYLALEDGFLRSVGLGRAGAPPISLTVDDLGVHYDASRPSRLERLIEAGDLDDPALLARARAAMDQVIAAGLSKTNAAPPLAGDLPGRPGRRILVIDQTAGDASIAGALAAPAGFARMLEAARDENPGADILVRRHPSVAAGLRPGCLPRRLPAGVIPLEEDVRVADVLARVEAVYTVGSLTGFEALIRGVRVRAFGLPFWAGWGASVDELSSPRRTARRTPLQLFAAACVLYARYVDPLTGSACGIETALARLTLFRDRALANAGFTACLGFAPWKHGAARTLLYSPRGEARFFSRPGPAIAAAARAGGRVVFWAGRETPALAAALAASPAPVVRMEDGFIRSRGLGSDFHPAASAALDDIGVYYDASRPSRLENLLERAEFSPQLLERARALRRSLISARLSKYNLDQGRARAWPAGARKVLVVGQVENDKSIERGCEGVASNLALLGAARADFPGAFIAYKPHPDVEAGNRPGAVAAADAARLADIVERHADIIACLEAADEVATMTSLAGFEGLLRGKPVTTYGRPFYGGWGLTTDRLAYPRRSRRLGLDELVAGALIAYPIYVDPASGLPCEVEDVVAALSRPAGAAPARRSRYWRAVLESLRPNPRARY